MKSLFVTLFALVIAAPSFAAEVKGARVNARKGTIEVDVVYGGGCAEHKFQLNVGACAETFPVQCGADLKDVTQAEDFCEALVPKTVTFSIRKLGLNREYYRGGSLTITGDNSSFATVRLPR